MRIGPLRHRLAIQKNTPTVDVYGERSNSWATQDTVWGSLEPISAGERLRAAQPQMDVTHKAKIRHGAYFGTGNTALLPQYRFVYASRNFRIKSILNKAERNVMLEVLCEETD